MSAGVRELGRLLRLKDRRLDAARAVLAAAVARVRAAEAELARRDAAVAALDAQRAGLDHWFTAPPADPRLIEAALARRELLSERRRQAVEARASAADALAAAGAERAEAARVVARAQGRRDAAARVLDRARALVTRRRESQAELELEERLCGAGAFA